MSLQSEIVELTAQGWGRPQIAQALGCSADYVRAALARNRRPEHYRTTQREWQRRDHNNNPQKWRARKARWREANPGREAEYKRQRRAKSDEQRSV